MNRNLALEFIRITEFAALESSRYLGLGDKTAADQAAVEAMRGSFEKMEIQGTVVIGEGERDQAPMLHIGEEVGRWGPSDVKIDIALDPLEGTNLCAEGQPGALSVIAASTSGGLLHAPDVYMDKLACGPEGLGVLSLQQSPAENIHRLAQKLNKKVEDVSVIILKRKRHEQLIEDVRSVGAKIHLISDGDISAALATCEPHSGVDLLMGQGGAPEGVISAAAMKCLEGHFEGQLHFPNEAEKERAQGMGVTNPDKIYHRDELASGPVFFAATGVTTGPLLEGVKALGNNKFTTHSVVMRSETQTLRFVKATHNFNTKSR